MTTNRTLTRQQQKAFEPQGMARNHDEEIGYRRGFDQGVAALAGALGIDGPTLQKLAFKRRVADFRHGRAAVAPVVATEAEKAELRAALTTIGT